MIRPIGRDRNEASPVNVALIGVVAIAPMIRRTPVPELPQSITSSGSANPPVPTPSMVQTPSSDRSTPAPKARIAAAVSSTSWPSSNPLTVVRPTLNAPRINDRCETDLSPGTCAVPLSGPAAVAVRGEGA